MNRRRFLAFSTSAITLLPLSSFINTYNKVDQSFLEDELQHLLTQWNIREKDTPEVYLADKNISVNSDVKLLKQQRVQDFKYGNVFILNGLVLSKTEAALLACTVT